MVGFVWHQIPLSNLIDSHILVWNCVKYNFVSIYPASSYVAQYVWCWCWVYFIPPISSFRHEGPVWQVAWAHPKFGSILASCSYDRKVKRSISIFLGYVTIVCWCRWLFGRRQMDRGINCMNSVNTNHQVSGLILQPIKLSKLNKSHFYKRLCLFQFACKYP